MTVNCGFVSTDSTVVTINPALIQNQTGSRFGNIDIAGSQTVGLTTPGSYPYQVLISDNIILASSSVPNTITMLASPQTGSVLTVKDSTGLASTNNITISGNGKLINGSPTFVMTSSGQTAIFLYNGSSWLTITPLAISVPISVPDGGTGATTLTGILTGNGTSAVTASAVTQHNVLTAGSGNTVSSVAPGTSGNVLTSNGTDWTSASPSSSSAPTGSIQYFATSGGSSFSGWLPCDGSVVSQATYPTLYSQIGLLGGPDTIGTYVTSGTNGAIFALTYGNSIYVASSGANNITSPGEPCIETSTDGITWSVTNIPINAAVVGLTYGTTYVGVGGVVIGGNAGIVTSTDAITWTSQTSGTSNALGCIAYGSIYVAGGQAGTILTSTDAVTWSPSRSPFTQSISCMTFANSLYLCGTAQGQIARSTDAITWSTENPLINNASNIFPSLIKGSIFVGSSTTNIVTSTDSITWTVRNSGTSTNTLSCLSFGLSTYVVGGNGGYLATSTDAITWASGTSGTTSSINTLVFGNNLFVYAGNGGVLRTSTDAITWDSRTSGTTSAIYCSTYGALYVYGGAGGVLRTSTDAITWDSRTSGTTSSILCMTYGTVYVYGGAGGVLRTSTDGITWDARTSVTTTTISCASYGNSLYLIGGAAGYLASSTDGTTWTTRNISTAATIAGIVFSGSTFYVADGSGRIFTSTNCVNWSFNSSSGTVGSNSITSISYGSGVYLYTSRGSGQSDVPNYVATSTDLITWTSRNNFTSLGVSNSTYGNSKFMVVGIGGTLATSTNGISWSISSQALTNPTDTYSSVTYGDRFVVGVSNSVQNSGKNIVYFNNTYSYNTATSFQLPTYNSLPITLQSGVEFPRSLYIKT